MIATPKSPEPLKLAVLISGTGRTLKNFIDLAAAGDLPVDIRLVISSSPTAGGLKYAQEAGITTKVCRREAHAAGFAGHKPYSDEIFQACRDADVDYVAMAGFVKYVPVPDDFENRVLNIHPALIPAFCGQGMYGHHVHEAVLEYGVKYSGCTVHFADNQYDCGPIIDQQIVPVLEDDTPETLADRVFAAECDVYPRVLCALAEGRVEVQGRHVRVRQ